ncbi:MAG: hypothetical protein WAM30_05180, partial [Candidatus Dormiibacterota bacterium]
MTLLGELRRLSCDFKLKVGHRHSPILRQRHAGLLCLHVQQPAQLDAGLHAHDRGAPDRISRLQRRRAARQPNRPGPIAVPPAGKVSGQPDRDASPAAGAFRGRQVTAQAEAVHRPLRQQGQLPIGIRPGQLPQQVA